MSTPKQINIARAPLVRLKTSRWVGAASSLYDLVLNHCCSSLRRRLCCHKPGEKCVAYVVEVLQKYLTVFPLASLARGEYLRTHFKNMREVAAALTGAFMR